MDQKQEEIEIDLLELGKALLKKWWVLIIITLLAGIGTYLVSDMRYVPSYKATAKMYVNNDSISIGGNKVSITTGDLLAAQSLVDTYCEILQTHLTLNEVSTQIKEKYGYDYNYYQLLSMISCGASNGTEVFYISVRNTDPEKAINIVNTIIEVLPAKIATVIDGSSAKTVDRAEDALLQGSGIRKNTAIGAIIGFVAAAALVIIVDVLINDKLKSSEWITQQYGDKHPMLGTVPDGNTRSGKKYGYYKYGDYAPNDPNVTTHAHKTKVGSDLGFVSAEAYNQIRSNVEFTIPGKIHGRIIGVTSALPQEGKSYNTINLAYTFAKDGKRVLVIDGDMRRPTVQDVVGLEPVDGLSSFLSGIAAPKVNMGVLHANLDIITSGPIPPNPSGLIGSSQMKSMLDLLKEKYDYIFIDLPPVLVVADAVNVSKFIDGVIFIVKHEKTTKKNLTNAVKQLEFANANILGIIYNECKSAPRRKKHKHSKKHSNTNKKA